MEVFEEAPDRDLPSRPGFIGPSASKMSTPEADPRKPMARDARGWRVAPAPDGRGRPDSPTRRAPHRSRGFALFALVLLAVNLVSFLWFSPAGQPRVKVPFSPYFVS